MCGRSGDERFLRSGARVMIFVTHTHTNQPLSVAGDSRVAQGAALPGMPCAGGCQGGGAASECAADAHPRRHAARGAAPHARRRRRPARPAWTAHTSGQNGLYSMQSAVYQRYDAR